MKADSILRHASSFPMGYTELIAEDSTLGMDFGVRCFAKDSTHEETAAKETAWLLMHGDVECQIGDRIHTFQRRSVFKDAPAAIHVPAGTHVRITSRGDSEWCVIRTTHQGSFEARAFEPGSARSEERGRGQADGMCTRIVRTLFDAENRPNSKLVLGEVVSLPGRWSSYPPHHHNQPEIYHYRFDPPQGYGHAEMGEKVFKVRSGDTLKILPGCDHAQAAAPGYSMYYVWAIRHLDGDKYSQPTFTKDHAWIMKT